MSIDKRNTSSDTDQDIDNLAVPARALRSRRTCHGQPRVGPGPKTGYADAPNRSVAGEGSLRS